MKHGIRGNVILLLQASFLKAKEVNFEINEETLNRKAKMFMKLDENSELFNLFIFSAKMVQQELQKGKFNQVIINFIDSFFKLESFFQRNLKSIEVKEKDIKNAGAVRVEKIMVRLEDKSLTKIYLGELKGSEAKRIIEDIRKVKQIKTI